MAAPLPVSPDDHDQPAEPINVAADPDPTTQMPAIDPGAMAAGAIPAEKTTGESMDSVASVVPLAVDPGPATTQMPAIDPSAIDSPATPTGSSVETMVLDEQTSQPKSRRLVRSNAMIFGSPAGKRSFEEESETAPANADGKGKAVARETDDINEPTRKRRRTDESATHTSTFKPPVVKQPLVTELHDFGSMTPNNPPARIQVVEGPTDDFSRPPMSNASSSETDANDSMKTPLLADDAADPTPYELSAEACAFLCGEAARGYPRFITANTRVQALEKQLNQENHNLEMRRSELLRVVLMLPRENRTTIWTNMGQPDAPTLLGLLPDLSDSIETSDEPLSDSIKSNEQLNVWNQPEGREDASQGSGSKASVPKSRESSKGFLEAQRVQAKASSKQRLQSRLEMEQDKDSEAMPPPPLPVIRSAGTSQRPSLARSDLSQSNIARQATSSQRPRSIEQSGTGSSASEYPYCAQPRTAMDDTHKAHPGDSISPEVLAWEGSTREYPCPMPTGPSRPTGPAIAQSEAKRNEETEDSQALVPAADADAEQRQPKKRKGPNGWYS